MSKILKSTTLGNVKNGGIFKALGKEFVKLDADEHDCLVLAKDIWTKMPFRDGDDQECPNDLRRSDVMKYLGNCLAEFTEKGTPLDTFIPFKIDPDDGEKELCEYTFKHCPECGAKVTSHKSCEFCRWHLQDGTCFNKHHSQPVTGREASCWNWEERE